MMSTSTWSGVARIKQVQQVHDKQGLPHTHFMAVAHTCFRRGLFMQLYMSAAISTHGILVAPLYIWNATVNW